jgi:hypothetical protein
MSQTVTTSKYIYSNRKNNIYNPTDIIEINIDRSNMFINTKEFYLAMEVQMQSKQYKVCPSGRAGLNAMIRNLQIASGTGSVLESINNYGLLYSTKDYYESTISTENRKYLHEGKPNKIHIDDESANQYVTPNLFTNESCFKTIEVCLPLYLSGCVSPNRDDIFPVLATMGLNLRIELTDANTALTVIKAPVYYTSDGQNFTKGEYGGYSSDKAYGVAIEAGANDDSVHLKNINDLVSEDDDDTILRILSADVAEPAHLFQIGQYINIGEEQQPGDNVYKVTAVAMDEGRIRLTFTPDLRYDIEKNDVVYVNPDAQYNDATYHLSNVKVNVGIVETGSDYVNSTMNLIKSGKFIFDIFSFTDYSMNISGNSTQNTLKINCRNTRALSLLCVPQDAQSNDLLEDSMIADKNTPRDYQFSLYNNVIVPSKLVPLDKFNHNNTSLYNAMALREMEKSLLACPNWSVSSLKNPSQQFFVGRELAKPGYSYNCNSELALNINYVSVNALLMHNYLCHLRQLDCRLDGVMISY